MMGPGMSRQKFIAIAAQVIIGWDAIQAGCLFASRRSTSALENVFEFLPIFLEDLLLRRFRGRAFAPVALFHFALGRWNCSPRFVPAEHAAQIVPIEPKPESDEPDDERSQEKKQDLPQPALLGLFPARHGA